MERRSWEGRVDPAGERSSPDEAGEVRLEGWGDDSPGNQVVTRVAATAARTEGALSVEGSSDVPRGRILDGCLGRGSTSEVAASRWQLPQADLAPPCS